MGPNNQKIRDSKHLKELSNGKLMKLYTQYVVENFKIQGFFLKIKIKIDGAGLSSKISGSGVVEPWA